MDAVSLLTGLVAWFGDGENWRGPTGVPTLFVQHMGYSALALGIACAIAVPLGLWLGHTGRGGVLAIQVSNVGRAVPTLAILAILVLSPPPLARSVLSLEVALVAFAIPPILTNTYVGVREVDAGAVDAARGMGMSGAQVLRRVELPLATPLLMNGVRLAAVQVVATVAIAAIFAFGGLGRIITRSVADAGGIDLVQVLAGSIVVAVVAVAIDAALAQLGRRVDPVARARRRSGERPGPRRASEQGPDGWAGASRAGADAVTPS